MDRAEAIERLENDWFFDWYGQFCVNKQDSCEFQTALDMAIAALREQEQSKWISVKERLPELEKEVLICDLSDERDERAYTDVWSLEDDEEGGVVWQGKNGEWYSLCDATHWMPLPEPPEGGAEG